MDPRHTSWMIFYLFIFPVCLVAAPCGLVPAAGDASRRGPGTLSRGSPAHPRRRDRLHVSTLLPVRFPLAPWLPAHTSSRLTLLSRAVTSSVKRMVCSHCYTVSTNRLPFLCNGCNEVSFCSTECRYTLAAPAITRSAQTYVAHVWCGWVSETRRWNSMPRTNAAPSSE